MKSHTLCTTTAALLATLATANARNLAESLPTGVVKFALDGVTPKPTSPPDYNNLFRRQEPEDQFVIVAPDATCGYISGRPGASYTCGPQATCAFLSIKNGDGAVACCNTEACGFRAACVDYDDFFSSSSCVDGCEVDILTLKCTSTSARYCNTISFAGGIKDYWCNNVDISTPQVASTTYKGQPEARVYETIALTDLTSEVSIATSGASDTLAATGDPTADSTSDSTADATASETSATETSEPSSGTPIGAIVGGVVGGVGALALAGLAAFFILRRKKQKKATDAASSPQAFQQPMHQHQQPGVGPGGYNPVPQGGAAYYDPKNGYASPVGQPGVAYYPTQSSTPDPNFPTNPSSPATTMVDPRMSQMAVSPSPSYVPGPIPGQQQPGYQPGYAQSYPQGHPQGQQPQQNVIHEADSEPNKQIQPSELA